MRSRPVLYGKLRVDFSCTSKLLYPNMKSRRRIIRARRHFYMNSNNPNNSLGIVDCPLYSRRIAFKHHYHKKGMDMLGYTPVKFKYRETPA